MKKALLVVVVLLTIVLSACQRVIPLDNPEPELFSVVHEGDDFTLLRRTEIESERICLAIALPINSPKGLYCAIGWCELQDYLVLYDDDYYDLIGGAEMNLFTATDLMGWGVNIDCCVEE